MAYRHSRGFTLIEVLVVVVIIAIIVSFATLSLGPREARMMKEEAERIAALVKLAEEESILTAQELALAVSENGYQFEVYDGANWQALAQEGVFRRRALPENMVLELTMDQKPVELPRAKDAKADDEKKDKARSSDDKESSSAAKSDGKKSSKTAKDEKDKTARAFILSSGEVTPFELAVRFEDRDDGYRIAVDERGEIKLEALKEKL